MIPDLFKTSPKKGAIVIAGVIGHHQTDGYSCSHTACATVIRAARGGARLTRAEKLRLWNLCSPHPTNGTPTGRMQRALRRFGLTMRQIPSRYDSIRRSIRAGNLVITSLQLDCQTANRMHWMVVAGVSGGTGCDRMLLLLNHTGLPGFTSRWWPWEKCRKATLGLPDCFHEVGSDLSHMVAAETLRPRGHRTGK